MSNIVTINVGGQELRAIERDFGIGKEEWNEYKLLDGGTVRIKTSAQQIFQVVDDEDKPKYTVRGDLHIVVTHKTDVVVRS